MRISDSQIDSLESDLCGDGYEEVRSALAELREWRKVEMILRRHSNPSVNPGAHALANACLKTIDQLGEK